ncbi:MAG TPA: pitrilysin family protein [Thiohalobacter sp.]|nr:pitrilysin family protein [Thiohalobacter sp.]
MRNICILLLGLCAALPAQAMEPIQHWVTGNGARVYFVPAPELPMVDVRMVFDAGSARDDGHPGLAGLTNGLLDQGAGEMDADAIAERLESVGARLDTGSRRDMAWVGLRSLSSESHLQPALEVCRQVVAAPTFSERDFERERRRALVGLQQVQQQPGEVAERAFYAALYGEHPYATPSAGTIESVQALEREQLAAFHRRYYVARNAVVAIVGDLDRARAERLAADLTAELPAGEAAPALPAVDALAAAHLQRIDHPSSQSHILMGQPGMRRGDADYFPLYVGNYVLGGGGLVSRISEEVREKRGLSYSAYSYFMPMARRGPFVLGLQTRNEQADAALQVLRETLANFVAEGPTEAEMEAARKHITGGFPLRIDSNSETLEYIAMIGFYGLPLDYLQRFNDRVAAVTRADVRDAFQRRVQPERMVTVIVGEPPAE